MYIDEYLEPFERPFIPVQLLSDLFGPYGLGIVDEIVLASPVFNHVERPLILRPDLVKTLPFPLPSRGVCLHGLRRLGRIETYEEAMVAILHREALKRNPRYAAMEEEEKALRTGEEHYKWWEDKKKLRNRIKFGQLKRAFITVNGAMKRLLAVADPDALRLARRFHHCAREAVYLAAVRSTRAAQLLDAFPALGLAIYSPPNVPALPPWTRTEEFEERHRQAVERWEQSVAAVAMVERGVRLNKIAGFMGMPLWGRRLKPAVAHQDVPAELARYLPKRTVDQQRWLRAIHWTRKAPVFQRWVARHAPEFGSLRELRQVIDIRDWVRECMREQPRYVTRPFREDMSVRTVRRLNEQWHEAIATTNHKASKFVIPPPWFPPGEVNGYQIVPVDSVEELYREGREMRNCVASYDARIAEGGCYIYSIRLGEKRLATAEISPEGTRPLIRQIAGPCNASPPKEIKRAVQKWLSSIAA
jgi:hypothetical protein